MSHTSQISQTIADGEILLMYDIIKDFKPEIITQFSFSKREELIAGEISFILNTNVTPVLLQKVIRKQKLRAKDVTFNRNLERTHGKSIDLLELEALKKKANEYGWLTKEILEDTEHVNRNRHKCFNRKRTNS
jgi:hypothetical protein